MDPSKSRRKNDSVILGCVLLVLLIGFVALNAFNFKSANTGEIVVFTGLSILAFMLLMAGLVLLVRNVLKLYADQRNSVMGTRLRTRMLWGAVLVSIIPLVFMFLFSYVLMNRAVDRWFEKNPDEIRNDSNSLALELAQYTSANARSVSSRARCPTLRPAPPRGRASVFRCAIRRYQKQHRPHSAAARDHPAKWIRRRLPGRPSDRRAQHAQKLRPAGSGKLLAA
jgi:two-component system nitrogen regulation sensor histidine kinase NtrY